MILQSTATYYWHIGLLLNGMKIRLGILILISVLCVNIEAQNNAFSYGLSPKINLPLVGSSDIEYENNIGFGLGVFTNYKLATPQLFAVAEFDYQRLNYSVLEQDTKISNDNFSIALGAKYNVQNLDNSSLIIAYKPIYVGGSTSIYQGTNNTGPREVNLIKNYSNRLSHNIYFGFELDLKGNNALVAAYNYSLNKNYGAIFIDAQPNYFTLGLKIGLGESWNGNNQKAEMQDGLRKLSADTLYFINRSCKGEMSDYQLDSILRANYTFSAFRVVNDSQIQSVKNQDNTLNFAVIGSYYPSLGDIPSSGIFLLDKNLNNLQYPYPHFIRLEFDFGLNKKLCLYSLSNAAQLVKMLDAEIKGALN